MGDSSKDRQNHNRVFSQLVFGNLRRPEVPSLTRSQKMPDEDSFSKEMNGEDNDGNEKDKEIPALGPDVKIDIERPKRVVNGLKISLSDVTRTRDYSAINYDDDSDDNDGNHDEEDTQKNDAKKKVKVTMPFWRRRNRIFSVRPTSADDDDKRINPRSAKQIRRMRKKVSVTDARSGKKPTNQADLAMAIVEGDLARVEDIVDAYVMLYGADGFNTVVGFRYDIDQRTMLITCVGSHAAAATGEIHTHGGIDGDDNDDDDSRNVEAEMYLGLSALHIACVFDQEQVLAYFLKHGHSASLHALLGSRTPSGQSLLHSCAWFGTVAPMQVLLAKGADISAENERRQQPLHLAALKGQMTCLKILVSTGGGAADLECEDRRGRSPLHEAVEAGHYDCTQELIHHDADVNKVDDVNGAPLHYASTVELVALLMANGADPNVQIEEESHHRQYLSSAGIEDHKSRTTVFSLYLRKMPEGCNEILSNYLHSNGTSIGAKNLEICFNYDLFLKDFERKSSDGEIRSLTRVAQLDQRDLLKHPVCESFLHMKWLLVRNYFRAYIFFYFQFLACLTTLVMLDFSPVARDLQTNAKSILTWICIVDAIVSVAFLIAKNIFLMVYNFGLYITTFQNFIEMMMLSFSSTFLILHLINSQALKDSDYLDAAIVHLAAISLFTSWFNFTLLQGKLPSGGIYINMVVGISRDFLKFLVLYTSTLIAFALCFHILSNDHENFKDPITSILCVVSMMVGEIDFTDNFTESNIIYKGTTEVVFVLFLLFVSIVIMNLLVGLAISNITQQFQSAGVYRLKMTVLLINMIEEALGLLRRICPCLVRNSQLFPYLLRAQEWQEDDGREEDVDMSVYVYPNEKGNTVYVKNGQGNRKRTSLFIPPWVLANTYKYLQRDTTGSAIAAATEKRRLEDKINKMSSEVRTIKWDVRGIRQELQSIVTFIKFDSSRTPRSKH